MKRPSLIIPRKHIGAGEAKLEKEVCLSYEVFDKNAMFKCPKSGFSAYRDVV